MTEMTPEQFMMAAGGGSGAPAFWFQNLGDIVKGAIVKQEVRQKTAIGDPNKKLFNKDGSPQMQLEVTLQTELREWASVKKPPTVEMLNGQGLMQTFLQNPADDTGLRRIYVWFKMRDAVNLACQAAGVQFLKNGGTLGIKFSGTEPNSKGDQPIKTYEAFYRDPVASEGFLEGAAPQQATPQYAPQQAAPQYAPQQAAPQYAPAPAQTQQAAPQYAPAPVQQAAPQYAPQQAAAPQFAPAPVQQAAPQQPAYAPPQGVPASYAAAPAVQAAQGFPQAAMAQPIAPSQQAIEPPF